MRTTILQDPRLLLLFSEVCLEEEGADFGALGAGLGLWVGLSSPGCKRGNILLGCLHRGQGDFCQGVQKASSSPWVILGEAGQVTSEDSIPTQGHQKSLPQCPGVADGLGSCSLWSRCDSCCVRLVSLTLSCVRLPRRTAGRPLEAGVSLSSLVPQEAKPHPQC